MRLGRHRLPQPAGDGARRARRLGALPGLVERVVGRPGAADRRAADPAAADRLDAARTRVPMRAIRRCRSRPHRHRRCHDVQAHPGSDRRLRHHRQGGRRPRSAWPSRWAPSSTRSASRSRSPTARSPRCSRRRRRSSSTRRSASPTRACAAVRDACAAAGVTCQAHTVEALHPWEAIIDHAEDAGLRPDRDGLARPPRRGGAAARQRDAEGADAHEDAGADRPLSALQRADAARQCAVPRADRHARTIASPAPSQPAAPAVSRQRQPVLQLRDQVGDRDVDEAARRRPPAGTGTAPPTARRRSSRARRRPPRPGPTARCRAAPRAREKPALSSTM